jgi:hypothetical protein
VIGGPSIGRTAHLRPLFFFVFTWFLFSPRSAAALDVRAKYEEALVEEALGRNHLFLDPNPEGKTVERIFVDGSQVIRPGDLPLSRSIPWTFLNHFHVQTREEIVLRELLFHIGDRYREDLVAESGRNLRSLFILSVARLVAVRGSAPDRVAILVVTKDQWSLRLNTEFTLDQARLDFISFSFSEANVAGHNKTVAIDFALDPSRYTVGAAYSDPRIWGSRTALSILADTYLARQHPRFEGENLSLTIGRPLYSLRTKWAWQASFLYLSDIVRFFKGGELATIPIGEEQIPDVYTRRLIRGALDGTRSFGLTNKINLTAGFRVASTHYGLPANFPTNVTAAAKAAFIALLPRSEDASGPYLSLSTFHANFIRLQDQNTFALSEDFRVGPSLALTVRYASHLFGFNSDFVELSGRFAETFFARDDLFTFALGAAARVQAGVLPDALVVNEAVTASFHNATPRFGPFRLHIAGSVELRNRDLDHVRLTLGSDNGLRGYAPREFQGNDVYVVNVELRTIPLNLWTLHVGAVVFYDGGDAPADLLHFGWHQDAGVGVRILIPQFNHEVLRLDLAFPFEKGSGGYAPRFSAAFGQAF